MALLLSVSACREELNVGKKHDAEQNPGPASNPAPDVVTDGEEDCNSEGECTNATPSTPGSTNKPGKNGKTKDPGPTTDTAEESTSSPETGDSAGENSSGPGNTGPAPDCTVPKHRACDQSPQAGLAHALGIACRSDGTPLALPTMEVEGTFSSESYLPAPSVLPPYFRASEGKRVVMLSTGRPTDMSFTPRELKTRKECHTLRPHQGEFMTNTPCPSVKVDQSSPYAALPKPLRFTAVDPLGNTDCVDNPTLVGRGDCSNTLAQLIDKRKCWSTLNPSQCKVNGVYDPASTRITLVPPPGIRSLSFDFAFLSAEYPFLYRHPERYLNDAFVVWLESSWWTGNVVFDDLGQAMTIENRLATIKDATNLSGDCPEPCQDKRLHGFAMQGHGGTPWLRTTIPVQPGKTLKLTFSIFELGSPFLDSFVYLDNMRWGCETIDRPVTVERP